MHLSKEQFKEKVLANQKRRKSEERQRETMINIYFKDTCYKNKKRANKRGEMLVLNETQVQTIKSLHKSGYTYKTISKMFKVTEDDIKKIVMKGEL